MLLQSKLASTSMTFKDVLEVRTQVRKGSLNSSSQFVVETAAPQNMKESKDRTEQFMHTTSAAAAQTLPSKPLPSSFARLAG